MHETESFERVKMERKYEADLAKESAAAVHQSVHTEYGRLVRNIMVVDNYLTTSLTHGYSWLGSMGAGESYTTPLGGSNSSISSTNYGGSRFSELSRAFRFYKWHMLGTAGSWFLLDVVSTSLVTDYHVLRSWCLLTVLLPYNEGVCVYTRLISALLKHT